MRRKLPLVYFPPTICWVDDNQLFLDSAKNLFSDQYNCLTFSDPENASDFLTSYKPPYSRINLAREFTESDIFDIHNHLPIDIDISEISRLSDDRSLRDEIALLIIDNNMPKMKGVDICRSFKDAAYKKILLTGETGPSEVIEAFNSGIIDKFISKDCNVADQLHRSIRELSYEYFFERTKNLLENIETNRLSLLSDPIFIDFFYNWCAANDIIEFYLINRHGCFLTKNSLGKTIYFIIYNETAKNDFIDLNDDVSEQSKKLLCEFNDGKRIPFFGIGKECWEFDPDEWDTYFYSSTVLNGREKYYWAIVNCENN